MQVTNNVKIHDSIQKVSLTGKSGDIFNVIWLADLHFENPDTDKKKLKKLLDENTDCYIFIGGDALDLMDSFGDPRQSKQRLSANQISDAYANDIMDMFCEFFKPYAKRILAINFGNHEGSFMKRYGLDISRAIAVLMNNKFGSNIVCGDYAGYVNLSFTYANKSLANKVIYYTHSSGSIGKRSKGALAIDILKGQHPSADIVIWEHDHETMIKPESIEVLSRQNDNLENKLMWFISVPTMKDEFTGPKRGFHHEKNMGKRVIGAVKMRFEIATTKTNKGVKMLSPEWLLV